MTRLSRFHLFIVVIIVFLSVIPFTLASAQGPGIIWDRPINLSNSTTTSTDPFLLADPAGVAHLFWAEKRGEAPGNQADTIIYTAWDGYFWREPVDIFISPMTDGNPMATFPRAVIDETGIIHLIWMSQPNYPSFTLNYSFVNAWEANDSGVWAAPTPVATDLTGQKYSADIAYHPNQGLHIAYARGIGRVGGRGVAYMKSMDGGTTWSKSQDIFTITASDRGASDVRVLLDPPNRVYVSWTEWDNSGNGQAVYFTASDDNGQTWAKPFPLAVRRGLEYERDWNNMHLLAPGRIISVWEGGFRAYRGSMVSEDGGATWSQPVDAFPWLVGDNGSVEFVRDGSNRLHLFLANRVREGFDTIYGNKSGLWHSMWQDDGRWSEPTLQTLKGGEEGMTNPKVTVIRGNQIIAVWYGSQVYEIISQVGIIQGAQEISTTPWEKDHSPLETPSRLVEEIQEEHQQTLSTPTVYFEDVSAQENPGNPVYAGVFTTTAVIIVAIVFFSRQIRKR